MIDVIHYGLFMIGSDVKNHGILIWDSFIVGLMTIGRWALLDNHGCQSLVLLHIILSICLLIG